MKKVGLFLTLVIMCFFGCKKKSNDDVANIPMTYDQIVASDQLTQQITTLAKPIIDNFIYAAIDKSTINVQEVANQIKEIIGVKNAFPNATGSAIIIQKSDGSEFAYLIGTEDDPRFFPQFKTTPNSINSPVNHVSIQDYYPAQAGTVYPSNRKALILAPFQKYFNHDINGVSGLLTNAGYSVDLFINEQVTIEKFKGDYLADYGVIIIDTHGIGPVNDGVISSFEHTCLSTGIVVDIPTTFKNAALIATGAVAMNQLPISSTTTLNFFTVTPQYIASTLTKSFPNSYIFLDACESAKSEDFVNMFMTHGAYAMHGYNTKILVYYDNIVATEIISNLTNGVPISDIYNMLSSDIGLARCTVSDNPLSKLTSLKTFSQKTYTEFPQLGQSIPNKFCLVPVANSGSLTISPRFGDKGDKLSMSLYSWIPLNNTTVSYNEIRNVIMTDATHKQTIPMFSPIPYPLQGDAPYWLPVNNLSASGTADDIPQITSYCYKSIDKDNKTREAGSNYYVILSKRHL